MIYYRLKGLLVTPNNWAEDYIYEGTIAESDLDRAQISVAAHKGGIIFPIVSSWNAIFFANPNRELVSKVLTSFFEIANKEADDVDMIADAGYIKRILRR